MSFQSNYNKIKSDITKYGRLPNHEKMAQSSKMTQSIRTVIDQLNGFKEIIESYDDVPDRKQKGVSDNDESDNDSDNDSDDQATYSVRQPIKGAMSKQLQLKQQQQQQQQQKQKQPSKKTTTKTKAKDIDNMDDLEEYCEKQESMITDAEFLKLSADIDSIMGTINDPNVQATMGIEDMLGKYIELKEGIVKIQQYLDGKKMVVKYQ